VFSFPLLLLPSVRPAVCVLSAAMQAGAQHWHWDCKAPPCAGQLRRNSQWRSQTDSESEGRRCSECRQRVPRLRILGPLACTPSCAPPPLPARTVPVPPKDRRSCMPHSE
jgi:hypothetical protein